MFKDYRVLFLKHILHHFSTLLVMSECPKVHFVALRYILSVLNTRNIFTDPKGSEKNIIALWMMYGGGGGGGGG